MSLSPASKAMSARIAPGVTGRPAVSARQSPLRLAVVGAHSGGGEGWPSNPAFEHTREGRRAEYRARWAQAMEAAQRGAAQRTASQNQSQWGAAPAGSSWQQQQQPTAAQAQHHHQQQEYYQQPQQQQYQQPQQQQPAPANGAQLAQAGGHALQAQTQGATTDVQFNLKFSTTYGESLRIIGSAPELGAWNLSQAPQMYWSMGDVWTATIPLPQSSVHEYKYVVVNPDGKPVQWQQGNNNVLAIKPDQTDLDVHDNWDGGQGSSVVSAAGSVTRENQLLSWANEIEAKMSTTKNELRQWRGELSAAKEEAKVARIEVASLKTELTVEKEKSKRQSVEIQALKQENSDLKSKLGESKAGFEKALETASMLMAEIDEVPPLPPVSGQSNGHPQPPPQGSQYENSHAGSWHEWQQASAAAGQHPSTSSHAGHNNHHGHQQQHQHDAWNGGNSYNAGYHSYNAGSAAGSELRWAGDQQQPAQGGQHHARPDHYNGHSHQ